MTTCNNCPNQAFYKVDDPGADEIHYCRPCLPLHLLADAETKYALPAEETTAPPVEDKSKK